MINKIGWGWRILIYLTLSFVTLTCSLTNTEPWLEDENESTGISEVISDEGNFSDSSAQWTIDQCNAIQDVSIELSRFIENDDGNGSIVCAYDHTITNIGAQPIRLIYFDRYYPSEFYQLPSEWKSKSVFEPGQSLGMTNNIFSNARFDDTPPRYECFVYSYVLVYEIPECRWITENGSFHIDILEIAEREPITSPCTLLSPVSYSQAVPDLSEGLNP